MYTRKEVTADSRGVIEIPAAGNQFYVEQQTGLLPVDVLQARPNGGLTSAFDLDTERALRVDPFGSLEIWGARPGSKWFVMVAGPEEGIGRRRRTEPVLLVDEVFSGEVANGGFNLPGRAQTSDTLVFIDVRRFRYVKLTAELAEGVADYDAQSIILTLKGYMGNGTPGPGTVEKAFELSNMASAGSAVASIAAGEVEPISEPLTQSIPQRFNYVGMHITFAGGPMDVGYGLRVRLDGYP